MPTNADTDLPRPQPFSGIGVNPSWEIVSRLPAALPDSNVEITIHPEPVPVAYHRVAELVPALYAGAGDDFDLVLHAGVADGRDYFAVEQSGSQSWDERWGYQNTPDVYAETFSADEQRAAWPGLPYALRTDLDLRRVVDLWRNRTADIAFPPLGGDVAVAVAVTDSTAAAAAAAAAAAQRIARAGSLVDVKVMDDFDYATAAAAAGDLAADDVRWSDDVGFYLCGFIYYTGLAELGKTRPRDVAFMHVPNLQGDDEIATGVDVTIELINSLVESWREGR